MEASSLLVQDLWNEVLDHLHDSKKDLLSSALACRAFTARAQMHLFYSIQFSNHLTPTRLAEILSSSPHLVGFIRDLSINPCTAEILTPIVQVAWSHVSAISLRGDVGEPAFELLSPLISLPTLRRVSFHDGEWDTHRLRVLLANCSPHVTSLAFWFCSTKTSHTTPDDNLAHLIRSSPLRITHLEFVWSTGIPDCLMDPACQLDLSRLLHVKSHSSSGPGLFRLLHTFCTIQSLDIQAEDLEHLDMGHFPMLSHVTVSGDGASLRRAIQRCCEGNVHTICLPVRTRMALADLEPVQAVILSTPEPRVLRRLEVLISTAAFSRTGWTAVIEGRMPRLAESGILAFKFPSFLPHRFDREKKL